MTAIAQLPAQIQLSFNQKTNFISLPTGASTSTLKWLVDNSILTSMSEELRLLSLYFTINNTLLSYDTYHDKPLSELSKRFDLRAPVLGSIRLRGGKGGFGSMLRAQGGRMNSKVPSNNDACRDLNGRRLKTVRRARKLIEHIELQKERDKERKEKLKKKIEKGLKGKNVQKALFDDHKYLKESEEIKSNMKLSVLKAKDLNNGNKKVEKRNNTVFDDDLSDSSEEEIMELTNKKKKVE
ncbi:hypothetical protein K502DRAFT_342033 [Neoconidiobolus thromboides FSU 785]|nr:hypothetical protein K502DRAFT_342033 [Neoconidiobolus thromboides FSU 785]